MMIPPGPWGMNGKNQLAVKLIAGVRLVSLGRGECARVWVGGLRGVRKRRVCL